MDPEPIAIDELVVTPGHFGVAQQEVTPARQTLTREDIETRPQLGEDIFRAVDRLPGLASDDVSTRLNVRGGLPEETLFLFDGLELYEPYHLKDFDGVLGIIDAEAVGALDLTTGGFTTEYGDKLTGVFNMQSVNPAFSGSQTSLGLSFTNLRFMSRGAFNGGRGQWVMSARRGYLDIVLGLTGGNDDLSPTYYDVFGKLSYQLDSDHLLSARVLYGGDSLDFLDDTDRLESGWTSGYVWLDWDARLSQSVSTNTLVSLGRVTRSRDGVAFADFDDAQDLFVDDNRDFDFVGVKQDWSLVLSERDMVRIGADFKAQFSDYDYLAWTREFFLENGQLVARFDTVDVATEPSGQELGLYASNRYRLFEPFTVELGLRYDRQTWSDDSDLSPRVNLALALGRRTNVRAAWGRYYQAHGLQELSVGDGETVFSRSELAQQLAIGVQHTLENGLLVRIEGYRRDISNPRTRYLNLDRDLEAFPELEPDRIRIDPTSALANGAELFVRRDVGGKFSWSGSYAIASAEDEIDGEDFPRNFDQRHTVVFDLAYRPNPKWQLSLAWQYHTGWPYTEAFFSADTLSDGGISINKSFGTFNAARLPAYHRLDLRATRNFRVGRNRLAVYLDVFNVYDHANLRGYEQRLFFNNGRLTVERVGDELLPLLPTFGVRFDF